MAEKPREPLPPPREDRRNEPSSANKRHDWQPDDIQILEPGDPEK